MTKKRFVIGSFLLPLLLGICTLSGLWAQPTGPKDEHLLDQHLQQAIQFVDYNKNDSALICLEPVWEQLTALGMTDSPLGLKVQLARARALEQKHRHSEAILIFNELIAKSKASQQWDTYASTCLSLTQLYEKLYRQQRSKEHLDLASIAISQHQLDSLYPSLLIRQAIWNINFGQHPDSIQYYSQKVLSVVNDSVKASPILRYSLFLVQGIEVYQINYLQTIEYYKKAVAVAKELNDPVRMSEAWHMIAVSYKDFRKELEKAFAYNDSTIMACYQAIEAGHERIHTLHNAYWLRSKFHYAAGQLDSAYYFLNKGLSQEITYIKQQQFDRVAEVDARYRDEQKTKQLEDQARTIAYEQRIRNLLLAIIVITLMLAVAFAFGLINRRKAMRKLADQNKLIQQQSEQLKSLDATKSRFFANISHELRTPLTLILGPIKSALKSGTLDNRNFTLLKKAQQSSEDLIKLVSSILDLSKLEHGKLELRESAEPIFPFVQRIVSTFESHAERSGIELTFIYKAEKNLQLKIDREKVETILNNLLSNAIKFTPKDGKVSITVDDKDNALELVVEDTGRGITQNDLPKVFNRFYQSEDKNAPTEGGTGIGLALCQELAHLMEGSIRAESTLGKGSAFFVEIPRKEVMGTVTVEHSPDFELSADQAFVKTVENEDATRKESTILVVEDNHNLRDYLTTILSPRYHILSAENGQEALSLLQEHSKSGNTNNDVPPPSLIISDLMMPIMDGFQLLEKLKSDNRFSHLPVVMLTARADIKDKLKALRIGVDDYILKPFDEEEIIVRIDNLLKNYVMRSIATNEEEVEGIIVTDQITAEDRQWLEDFETHVLQNLSDETLSVPKLAQEFAMSESTILRQLKRLTGLTPAKYLQEIRLDKARQLLEGRTYNSIAKVAEEVGYADSSSFSRSFKKRFGKSPTDLINT